MGMGEGFALGWLCSTKEKEAKHALCARSRVCRRGRGTGLTAHDETYMVGRTSQERCVAPLLSQALFCVCFRFLRGIRYLPAYRARGARSLAMIRLLS